MPSLPGLQRQLSIPNDDVPLTKRSISVDDDEQKGGDPDPFHQTSTSINSNNNNNNAETISFMDKNHKRPSSTSKNKEEKTLESQPFEAVKRVRIKK